MKSIHNIVILLVWMYINSKGVSGLMQLSLPSVKYIYGPTVADDDVYYGYAISFDNSTETTSLLIGAPSTEPGNSSLGTGGQIFFCTGGIDFSNQNSSTNCKSSSLFEPPQNGGDLGCVLEASPTGTITGCSPSKSDTCGPTLILPGYCATFNITDDTSNVLPKNEQACRVGNVDVLFLLDSSDSIAEANFGLIKDFTNGIINLLDGIDSGAIRIGVFQFSNFPEREIELNNMLNRTELTSRVSAITALAAGTNSGRALNKTYDEFKSVPKQSPGDARVLIFLTDGQAEDTTAREAQRLRDSGVQIYAIGVGAADVPQLRIIATGDVSSNERVFSANFSNLATLVAPLQTSIASFSLEGSAISGSSLTYELGEIGFSVAYSTYNITDGEHQLQNTSVRLWMTTDKVHL